MALNSDLSKQANEGWFFCKMRKVAHLPIFCNGSPAVQFKGTIHCLKRLKKSKKMINGAFKPSSPFNTLNQKFFVHYHLDYCNVIYNIPQTVYPSGGLHCPPLSNRRSQRNSKSGFLTVTDACHQTDWVWRIYMKN